MNPHYFGLDPDTDLHPSEKLDTETRIRIKVKIQDLVHGLIKYKVFITWCERGVLLQEGA